MKNIKKTLILFLFFMPATLFGQFNIDTLQFDEDIVLVRIVEDLNYNSTYLNVNITHEDLSLIEKRFQGKRNNAKALLYISDILNALKKKGYELTYFDIKTIGDETVHIHNYIFEKKKEDTNY